MNKTRLIIRMWVYVFLFAIAVMMTDSAKFYGLNSEVEHANFKVRHHVSTFLSNFKNR